MKTLLSIVGEVIDWLKIFAEENPDSEMSLKSFIIWLNSKLFADELVDQPTHDTNTLNMELSFLLALQNRHYKAYAKSALGESELSSLDSFSFLYHLSVIDSFRKMELIKMHQLEPPSGIEVLKRLLKKDLIEEFDDPDDKRARRIRITVQGKQELQLVLPKMQKVFASMTAEMSINEKLHVVSFLKQMHDYHLKNSTLQLKT